MPASLDLIGIVVQDMKRSLDFYRALGLVIQADQDGERHVEVVLANGLRLAWDTVAVVRSFDLEWQSPSGGHRISLDWLCDSVASVDAVYQELAAKGYQGYTPPFDAFWGQRYALVKDPDGNKIALFAPLG
jgi:uncharacterized glyoxalase superfamily protein PhnB